MFTSSSPEVRLRWTLLGALLVLTLGVQAASFDYFVMPGPDFLDLRATAERFARGEAPLSFRVAPLYPALMAAVSPLADGWDPLLRAAEGWNLLFAVLTTYALFRVGERFLGRWGFLVPLLHFLHPAVTGEMLAQPLVEQTLLVLTAWTVLLALGRSPWAWLAAALASVARYEGVGLLAGLALLEFLERRPLPRIALRGALASVPLALWLGWSLVASGTLNPYLEEVATGENPYLEDAEPASRANFAKMAAFSFLRFLPEGTAYLEGEGNPRIALAFDSAARGALWTGCAAASLSLVVYGAVLAWRRDRGAAVLILAFLAFYGAVHTLYPVTLEKHFFGVHWALYLFALLGARAALGRLASAPAPLRVLLPVGGAAALLLLAPSPADLRAPLEDEETPLGGWSLRPEDANAPESILLFAGELPPALAGATPSPGKPDFLRVPLGGFARVSGNMWSAEPPPLWRTDNDRADGATLLRLYEDDRPLGPGASGHADIESPGEGRFSLWRGEDGVARLLFSTSDGSSPLENGRRYWAGDLFAPGPRWERPDPRGRLADADALRFAARAVGRADGLTLSFAGYKQRWACATPGDAFARFVARVSDEPYEPGSLKPCGQRVPASARGGALQDFALAKGAAVIESPRAVRAASPAYAYLWAAAMAIALRALLPLLRSRAWALALLAAAALHFGAVVELGKIRRLNADFRLNYAEHFLAGRWLGENATKDDLLIAENQHVLQYAAGGGGPRWRDIEKPVEGGTPEAVLEGLRAEGVTLLAVDGEATQAHERIGAKLALLREGAARLPGLRRVHQIDIGRKWADIYRIERSAPPQEEAGEAAPPPGDGPPPDR